MKKHTKRYIIRIFWILADVMQEVRSSFPRAGISGMRKIALRLVHTGLIWLFCGGSFKGSRHSR